MRKSEIKPAIARVFSAIINADGIVSMKELEYLENELKPKYQLYSDDFEKSKNLTFAEAVQIIKTQIDDRFNYKGFIDDIDSLAKADGDVHTKEALLCLALQHTIDDGARYLKVKLVSCGTNHLKFSKNEIIYLESEKNPYINEIIDRNYAAICYMLQSFGFQFIYIPKIKEIFQAYSIDYQKEILKYLYPYNSIDEIYKSFTSRLDGATTEDFTNMILSDCRERMTKPSLMIKIASTQNRNRDHLTDFLLLDVVENGFLTTIQRFLDKYDRLSSRNTILVQRGEHTSEFNSKSFQRTFVEYLYNKVSDIEIHLDYSHKPFVRLGSIGEFTPPAKSLALYITLLYYSYKSTPFIKNWNHKHQMREQMDVFYKVYQLVTDGGVDDYLDDEDKGKRMLQETDFYNTIQVDYNKLKDCFGKLPNNYLHQFAPTYDRASQTYGFTKLLAIQIISYKQGKKVDENVDSEMFTSYIETLPSSVTAWNKR